MKTLMLALSLSAAAAFGQHCTGPAPAKPATSAGCSDMRRACECDGAGSCTWAWSCLNLTKPINTKPAPAVSLNRQPAAPVDNSDQPLQAIQNLKLRNQASQLSLLKPPVSAPPSEEPAPRVQKQEEQNAVIIQLLQRIAVATETIARGMDQQHK